MSARSGALGSVLALALAAQLGCGDDAPAGGGTQDAAASVTDAAAAPYSLREVPSSLPPMLVPSDNPTTLAGAALGRKLYYDTRTSPNGARACATCHLQNRSFTSNHATGVLPHINLAWSENFLWDGHYEGTLEDVMLLELEDFFETDVERLREPDLEAMFEAAFGTPEVTLKRAAYALAQFQRTLVSGDSRYDAYAAGERSALSEAEERGMRLFFDEKAECFHCHASALFTDSDFHNIGLDAEVIGKGRGAITGNPRDYGKWKTPTLRNVELTAPYMHDDRFATLEEVVDFYSEGVVRSPTLDLLIPVGGFGLNEQERADLVAFLKSLTDDSYLEDPRLGPPP